MNTISITINIKQTNTIPAAAYLPGSGFSTNSFDIAIPWDSSCKQINHNLKVPAHQIKLSGIPDELLTG